MNRKEIILAGLAPAKGGDHSPVQVQKLFFLIDKNVSEFVGGPFFDFKPYNYGPFDKNVYETLNELSNEGQVILIEHGKWLNYKLSESGQQAGDALLESIPPPARDYIKKVSNFVMELSFSQLVSAIYKAYPEMRANSVFQK